MNFPARKPFTPPWWLRNGHAQTLVGAWYSEASPAYRARPVRIALSDGDTLVAHDDRPAHWKAGERLALLVHGLCGSHASGYMRRVAHKLNRQGLRTVRLDLRGCGAGVRLAQRPYHSGQSDDAKAVVEWLARESPGSPVTAVGFSLGGNIVLKLLGETGEQSVGGLDSGVAVNPPVDLQVCVQAIRQRTNRLYDRYFVRTLLQTIRQRRQRQPEIPPAPTGPVPQSLWDFDDRYTAPISGFGAAENYYRQCSSARVLGEIRKPTLILTAANDPLVPAAQFQALRLPSSVRLWIAEGGGHLGFIGQAGVDADRHWMDWRVVEWIAALPRRHAA